MDEPLRCCDCHAHIGDEQYATEVNPRGGYGEAQAVVCDSCMTSGRWDHWIKEHWPEWPVPFVARGGVI